MQQKGAETLGQNIAEQPDIIHQPGNHVASRGRGHAFYRHVDKFFVKFFPCITDKFETCRAHEICLNEV